MSILRSAQGLEILKGIVAIPNSLRAKRPTGGCEAGKVDGNSLDGLYCHLSLITDGWSSHLLPPQCPQIPAGPFIQSLFSNE